MRRRDGAADVDVEAGPLALAVGQQKPAVPVRHAADQRAARLDGVEILAGHGVTGNQCRSEADGPCQ